MTQASLFVSDNPLCPAADPQVIEPGKSIASLCPQVTTPVVCRYNGLWILRKDWERPVQAGDIVEFYVQPSGKGALRTLLQVAVMIVAYTIIGPAAGAAGSFAFNAAVVATNLIGSALINAVIPMTPGGAGASANTSPSYNVALQGNQARLDAPIPVIYGYNKIYPNLAAQPYVYYDGSSDQYYHALLVLGHGEFEIIRTLIDDTLIDHFSDVRYKFLRPGEPPSAMTLPSGYTATVSASVVTAEEVVGLDMETGVTIGPFAACAPKQLATKIEVDFGSPALGIASGSSMSTRTVEWVVRYRPIDDFGLPAGEYETLATQTLSAATASPIRRSYSYDLPSPMRVEVAVTRLDVKSDDTSNYDDLSWLGLRAVLDQHAPLCGTATHLQVIIRANEQLSSMTQRKIGVIATRKLRMWDPIDGFTTALFPTRNPAWALLDKWTDDVYGDGLAFDMAPDNTPRFDLHTLCTYAKLWDERQDRFDYIFDTDTDSNSADQLIARSGRAAVFTWYGTKTIARDQADPLPARAFTGRNIAEGSWSFSYAMPSRDMPDGLIVEYLDNRSWKPTYINCPMPGVITMNNPQRVKLPGITGAIHAEREGRFMAAALLYRRGNAKWTSEMEGALLTYNACVRYAPPMPGWAGGGDVVSWNRDTRVMGLSEEVPAAEGYILFIDDLGRATQPIAYASGAGKVVTLAADPGVGIVSIDANRERTRYLIGDVTTVEHRVRVRRVEPSVREFGGPRMFDITAVIEDDRVHEADLDLLPGVGEVQDPVDDGTGTVAAGSGALVNITDALVSFEDYGSPSPTTTAGFKLLSTGGLVRVHGNSGTAMGLVNTPVVAQWITSAPIDSYEVFAELLDGAVVDSSATGSWLALSTDQAWYVKGPTGLAVLRVSIRKVSGSVQDTATFTLQTTNFDPGGGI